VGLLRDEKVGALGELRGDNQRRVRPTGAQAGQILAHPFAYRGCLVLDEIAVTGDADDERNGGGQVHAGLVSPVSAWQAGEPLFEIARVVSPGAEAFAHNR